MTSRGTAPGPIEWQGAFLAYHSLALVNRELALALRRRGALIRPRHLGSCEFTPQSGEHLADLFNAAGDEGPAELVIRHAWPPDFSAPNAPRMVMIQPWEYGSLPAAWLAPMRHAVDRIWVPSTWVRDGYVESGVPAESVKVVPNGVNTARYRPGQHRAEIPEAPGFRFLFVGGTIARKGIDILIKAFLAAFTSADDVTLVIKDFGAQSFYKGQDAAGLIAQAQQVPNAPRIVHITRDLSEEELIGLYAACDCLVHPYRGEGYGLPVAEAMACGLPVIVTAGGATRDFTDVSNSYQLPARRVQFPTRQVGDIPTVGHPYWLEPDQDALVDLLRHVADHPGEAAEVGARAAADIAERHTWEVAAEVALADLRDLLETPGRSRLSGHRQKALHAARAGDWATARSMAQECLLAEPEDWESANVLAVSLYRLGEADQARHLLENALETAPCKRDLHHNLAFMLLEADQPEAALPHAAAAFAESPDSPELRSTLQAARDAVQRAARRLRRRLPAGQTAASNPEVQRLQRMVEEADALLTRGAAPAAASRPRLSLVMIAKNEERFLPACLESVRGVVDEIVLVDTGSTDRTVEIARQHGAKVLHRAWDEDFSAARNHGLEHATGDWALWLDADERLPQGEGEKLRRLVESAPPEIGGYSVTIRNYLSLKEGAEVIWHRACRLFRVHPRIRFTGRIHEQILRSVHDAGFGRGPSDLVLDHYGYASDVVEERNKNQRFISMLEREVRENLDPSFLGFHLYNLANAYYTASRHTESIPWFEKAAEAVNLEEEYAPLIFIQWAMALFLTGRPEEALTVCDRADALGIRHPAIHFARGHSHLHLGQYADAEAAFRRVLAEGQQAAGPWMGDEGATTYKAHYGLGLALVGQERYEEAAAACRAAVQNKPNFEDAAYLLGHCLRRLGSLEEARAVLSGVLAQNPHHTGAISDLGCVLCDLGIHDEALPLLRNRAWEPNCALDVLACLGRTCEHLALFDEALEAYQRICKSVPDSVEARVNAGRMLAELGRVQEAVDCFADAIQSKPDYANAYFCAGDLLYRLGYYPQAADAVTSGLERNPTNAGGFLVLGNCYFQTRDFEAARLAFRQALALDPGCHAARENLALTEEALADAA
jgi:tetratricopeptide (TPR) repeat protein